MPNNTTTTTPHVTHPLQTPAQAQPGQPGPFAIPPIPSRRAQGLDQGLALILYILGSTGIRDFLMPLGVTGYKTGLTLRRDAADRIDDLNHTSYADIVADQACPDIVLRRLEREWFLNRIKRPVNDPAVDAALARLSHAQIVDGVVKTRLSPGVSFTDVERNYAQLLAPRDLNAYLGSPDGAKRLTEVGLPGGARLFSDYRLTARPRRSLATEIAIIRPARELHVLLEALCLAIELSKGAGLRA